MQGKKETKLDSLDDMPSVGVALATCSTDICSAWVVSSCQERGKSAQCTAKQQALMQMMGARRSRVKVERIAAASVHQSIKNLGSPVETILSRIIHRFNTCSFQSKPNVCNHALRPYTKETHNATWRRSSFFRGEVNVMATKACTGIYRPHLEGQLHED